LKVCSPDECFSNILLKKRVVQRDVEASLLLNIQEELKLAYEDLGDNSVILNSMSSFFEYASFDFVKENGDTVLCRLHIGDVVTINIEDEDNFAIIKAIFCHQKNDTRFAFIIVDWFEKINRITLGCPVYRLQTTNSNFRKVFSISLVDAINTVHFVHNCKEEECMGNHDFRNNLYIRNMYFFKAI